MITGARAGVRPAGIDDETLVVIAAERLGLKEFDLFREAYRDWFGDDADEAWLERVFVGYMFQRGVPPWVRRFCRAALDAAPPLVAPYRESLPRVLARDLGALALVVVAGPWMLAMAPSACSAGIAASSISALENQVARDAGLPPC